MSNSKAFTIVNSTSFSEKFKTAKIALQFNWLLHSVILKHFFQYAIQIIWFLLNPVLNIAIRSIQSNFFLIVLKKLNCHPIF